MLAKILFWVFIPLSVVLFIFTLVISNGQRKISKELTDLLMQGKFDEFDELTKKKFTQMCIKPYNLLFLKLNAAMMKKNNSEIKNIVAQINELRKVNVSQRIALEKKLFFYYLSDDNKTQAEKVYKRLEEMGDYTDKQKIDILYDTMIKGGYSYLNYVLEQYNKLTDDAEKFDYDMLLVNMYTNKGDEKEAKKYDNHMKNFMKTFKNE